MTAADTSAAPEPKGRLETSTKLFYGLGSVAFGVKDNGFSYLLLLFYNQVIGLPASQVALALTLALIFDAFMDPLIGYASDNLHSRWGRRHPFMYAAALPVALGYMALWNPPHWDPQALFWYLVVLSLVIRTFISFYEVPSSALAAEFTSGYDDRSTLLSYRVFFAWIGGLSIQFLAFAVLLKPDATHPVGQLNPAGYARYGLIAACIMFVAILVSAAGTHRHIPTMRPPPPRRKLTLAQSAKEMRETLSNRAFLFILASSIATAIAGGLVASMNGYFNTYFWGFSANQIAGFTLGVFLSAFMGLALGPRLSRWLGKRRSAMTLLLLAVAILSTPIILRLMNLVPANGSPVIFWIIMVTSILGTACAIVAGAMSASMVADVVEVGELRTGRRSEGVYFAASSFVSKAVSGFGVLGAGVLIDTIGLKTGMAPDQVPLDVLRHMALIYLPVVIGLYLVGLLLLFGYDITRSSHAATLRTLSEKGGEGASRDA